MIVTATYGCRGPARDQPPHGHWEVRVTSELGIPCVTTDEVVGQWFRGDTGEEIHGFAVDILDSLAFRTVRSERLN